jgi:PEP-CTERM motif
MHGAAMCPATHIAVGADGRKRRPNPPEAPMLPSFRCCFPPLALCVVGLLAGSAAPALANPFTGALYEAFGADGLGALDLADPGRSLGTIGIAASNVVAGDGKVYFDSGATIYSANPDLSGLTNLHQNGAAPAGLALDAADGILYETFGADGVTALDLANPGRAIGFLGLAATNIVYGDGTVYLQSGSTIYSANADLAGLTTFHLNGEAPTGLAFLPPTQPAVPEPATLGLFGVDLLAMVVLRRRRLAGRCDGRCREGC